LPSAAIIEMLSAATIDVLRVAIDLLTEVAIELPSAAMTITELLSAGNEAAKCSHN
jgi:hypothetical protein